MFIIRVTSRCLSWNSIETIAGFRLLADEKKKKISLHLPYPPKIIWQAYDFDKYTRRTKASCSTKLAASIRRETVITKDDGGEGIWQLS